MGNDQDRRDPGMKTGWPHRGQRRRHAAPAAERTACACPCAASLLQYFRSVRTQCASLALTPSSAIPAPVQAPPQAAGPAPLWEGGDTASASKRPLPPCPAPAAAADKPGRQAQLPGVRPGLRRLGDHGAGIIRQNGLPRPRHGMNRNHHTRRWGATAAIRDILRL